MATNGEWVGDASRRELMARASLVGLLMRHTVNLIASLVALTDPASLAQPAGKALLVLLTGWSLYRVSTRSQRPSMLVADYLLVLAVCLAIPLLVPDPDFPLSNTAPQAIAGTAVVSLSVSVSLRASVPMTLGIAAAYACGAAGVVGWAGVSSVTAIYYFAVQCATASVIRLMLLRVAAAVDRARRHRHDADVARRVSDALRGYEREQLALLHDTAASTLLVVGQGTAVDTERLAAQARRDLDLLDDGVWVAPPPRVELVAALRDCAGHLSTPVRFSGREQLWLPGEVAQPVVAAAREVMNNVDRHARATCLTVTVADRAVQLADDGVGFDPTAPRSGHGLDDSIVGRMRRAGGRVAIESAPGTGTTVELCWAPTVSTAPAADPADPDGLVDRTRTRYALAIIAYALTNLAISVPPSVAVVAHPSLQVILGVLAACAALAALPGILRNRWHYAWPAAAALLVVALAQPMLLPADLLLGYPHWAQGAIGWCLLPLALKLPTRAGAAVLTAYWLAGSAVIVLRDSSAAALVNVGLGTASILGVQLFALIFNGLMRDAAGDIAGETREHQRLVLRDRITTALRDEYHRRYATIVDNVVPLLDALTRGTAVDAEIQARARAECRRLRALFDQAGTFDHALMQRIRPVIDAAEDRGVDVVTDVAGTLPDLPDIHVEALMTSVARVLECADSSARLILTAADGQVEASVVIDSDIEAETLSAMLPDTEIIADGAMRWCLVRREVDSATPLS